MNSIFFIFTRIHSMGLMFVSPIYLPILPNFPMKITVILVINRLILLKRSGLSTFGVTLVPTTVLALRDSLGSNNPADFMFIGLIGTILSCVGGIVIERLLRRPIK